MLKKGFILLYTVLLTWNLSAQEEDLEYSFTFLNPLSQSATMKQSDENFLSAYRFVAKEMNKMMPRKYSYLIQLDFLVLTSITQNVAQQSILQYEKISSSSVPHFFNKRFSPYVYGVWDADLQQLRDTRLSSYIRLHTGPFESNYALVLRSNSLLSWNRESLEVLNGEYYIHKYFPFAYYFYGLFDRRTAKEETNELERDVTGNKIYGAIRHLHRPDMAFSRYTNYKDLSDEERQFVKRVGWRSILNLIDPTLFWNGFRLNNGNKVNFMFGYNMAPFGDYIDQHFWLKTRTLDTHFYLREYENRNTWFPEAGIEFANVQAFDWMFFDIGIHAWQQPKDLDFNTNRGRFGGAIDATFKLLNYEFIHRRDTYLSLNIGVTAKTEGYLLETVEHGKHIDIHIGASLWFE
jgi:hypothetical protein